MRSRVTNLLKAYFWSLMKRNRRTDMLLTLVKIRAKALLSGLFADSRKKTSKGRKILYSLLLLYALVVFMGLFGYIFAQICDVFVASGLGWLYFALMGLMIFLLCFIGSVFATQNQIFEAKDNEMLLAMPVRPRDILMSRMISLLGLNLIMELVVLIPGAAVFIYKQGIGISGGIILVVSAILLPFMVMAVSALAGWLIALISSRMRRKNAVVTVLTVVMFMAYMYVCFMWQRYVNVLLENGEAIGDAVKRALPPFYHLGTGIFEGSFVSLLIFAAFAIVPFAAVYFIIASSFVKIATTNRGRKKIEYKAKAMKVSGQKTALVKKEMAHFFGSPSYMFNAGIGLVFMPVVAAILWYQLRKDEVAMVVSLIDPDGSLAGAAVCAMLGLLASMVTISAPSVSLEGKTMWILKSLPVSESDAIMTKAWAHVVLSMPCVLLSAAIYEVALDMDVTGRIMVIVYPAVMTVFFALLGLLLNLRFPKFDWINEAVAVKQSMSVFITVLLGMILSIAPVVLYFLAIRKTELSAGVYVIIVTAVFAVLSAALYAAIKKQGVKMWNEMAG